MAGASAIQILKYLLDFGMFSWGEIGYLLIGATVAFAVSMLAIKFLMNFVKKHDFKAFGWYRIALGAVVIASIVILRSKALYYCATTLLYHSHFDINCQGKTGFFGTLHSKVFRCIFYVRMLHLI